VRCIHKMLKIDLESLTGDCESYSTNEEKKIAGNLSLVEAVRNTRATPSYLLQETTQIGPQGEIRPFLLAIRSWDLSRIARVATKADALMDTVMADGQAAHGPSPGVLGGPLGANWAL
jgi:hypothetical protein